MNSSVSESPTVLVEQELGRLVGPENVFADEATRAFYSTDIYRRAEVDVALVVRPQSVEQLAKAIALCTTHGLAVVPRGGGLSYTEGFLPTKARSVSFDVSNLNRIVKIDSEDMYVTVEAGCTWRALYEALNAQGLRTPYFGPMSGYASTVGGALSQGSVFLGSTQYGSTADSTLGLQIVLADGNMLTTGSAGSLHADNPFMRNYGPDLTGLFLHDAGAMGFKARVTLRLIRKPEHSGFLSFTFGSYTDLLTVMSEIGREGLAAECFGSDPFIWNMRLWNTDLSQDMKRLVGVVKANRRVLDGFKDAVRIAAKGRRALGDVEFALNVVVDGDSEGEIAVAMARIRNIASAGREIEATVPKSIRATPFLPPNDMLGPKGERWAPIHGIAPHSRAEEVVTEVNRFFNERADIMERCSIEWGYVLFAISTNAVLIEPMIYWPGVREPFFERMIESGHFAKLPQPKENSEADEAIAALRADLTLLFMKLGCAHLQIGKTYRYLESRLPTTRALLEDLKNAVDPDGLMNPGALGLAE